MEKGHCNAIIQSGSSQQVKLIMPRKMVVKSITVNNKKMPVTIVGIEKYGTTLLMNEGSKMAIDILFESKKQEVK